jgi:hypothetical protein
MTASDDALARACADLESSWRSWRDPIAAEPSQRVDVVERLVAVALNNSASPDELTAALHEYDALPSHTTPPPWVGHFYGGLHDLLRARLASDDKQRAKLLRSAGSFSRVEPDGTSRKPLKRRR